MRRLRAPGFMRRRLTAIVHAPSVARAALTMFVVALTLLLASGAGAFESSHSTTACPRLGDAVSLPLRPGRSPLRADVDGDGRRDNVTVRYAPRARATCGFVLVVKAASREWFAVRIPESYKPPQDLRIRDWPFPEPYLAAAVKLDADRSQIVVARWHGASVANVSLYGLVDGRLFPLRFHPRTPGDQLSLFGTFGTGSTYARCVRGGPLIVIGIGPRDSAAQRSEYRLARGGLWRGRTLTVKGRRRRIDALARRWGIDAAPFTGCVVAHGRRL
jgi:hypothetical protein